MDKFKNKANSAYAWAPWGGVGRVAIDIQQSITLTEMIATMLSLASLRRQVRNS